MKVHSIRNRLIFVIKPFLSWLILSILLSRFFDLFIILLTLWPRILINIACIHFYERFFLLFWLKRISFCCFLLSFKLLIWPWSFHSYLIKLISFVSLYFIMAISWYKWISVFSIAKIWFVTWFKKARSWLTTM